nr:MAG TPA: hypothetical protein [Caudoviricetes sp.]DAY61815.1 MAG TPA: hypothetical protein [Caudoviricetes sp.]
MLSRYRREGSTNCRIPVQITLKVHLWQSFCA